MRINIALCYLLVGTVLILAGSGGAWAAVDRSVAYTVRGIAVDVTAQDAAEARELALVRGQRAAYRRLLSRLTMQSDRHKWPSLDDADIAQLVLGIEIENEKTSPVRYIASLTVSFKLEAVRALLGGLGIAFSETVSKPILVIPVYEEAGERWLWEDSNPWLAAWRDYSINSVVVPMVLPLADLADFATISPDRALRGDPDSLQKITRRYDVIDALVVRARFRPGDAGRGDGLDIALGRYSPAVAGRARMFNIVSEPGETTAGLFKRAISQVIAEVETSWKIGNLRRADGRSARLPVEVTLGELADWVAVEKNLAAVPLVQKTTVVSFSRQRALINLHFFGTVEQLRVALAQSDLSLNARGAGWVLSRQTRSP